MAGFRSRVDDIRAAGGELVIVGSGRPSAGAPFRAVVSLPDDVPLLHDTRLASYRAAGFVRGAGATLNVRSMGPYLRAMRKGFCQGRTEGDPWQLGGVMVVGTDGSVAYRYASSHGGDHPPPDDAIAALRMLPSAPRSQS